MHLTSYKIMQYYFTLDPFWGLLMTPSETSIAASLIKFTHTQTQFLHPSFTLCSPKVMRNDLYGFNKMGRGFN